MHGFHQKKFLLYLFKTKITYCLSCITLLLGSHKMKLFFGLIVFFLLLLLLLDFTTASPISVFEEDTKSSLTENKKNFELKVTNDRDMNLHDYHPIDPPPADSRDTIKYGPIEHGTPVVPYIPKPPTPPYHPNHAASPSPS